MAFMFFCLLVFVVVAGAWKFVTDPKERTKTVAEFRQQPFSCAIVMILVCAIFMFVVGVFVPEIGNQDFLGTGWRVWLVGGATALALWLVTLGFKNGPF